jgi:hypothetical protein
VGYEIIIKDGKKEDVFKKIPKYHEEVVKQQLDEKTRIDTEFIFFDYETVSDFTFNGVNIPYSLACFKLSLEELNRLDKIEMEYKEYKKKNDVDNMVGNKRSLDYIIERNGKFFTGYDCSKQFLEYLRVEAVDKKFYLIGFNSCNFDNYILYRDIINEKGVNKNENITDPLIANGQLLNFKIDGRHELLDVRKHLGGSLIKNCESFGIDLCSKKKDLVSFYEMQEKYEKGELLQFINSNKDIMTYNIYDCVSLAVLFIRYRKAMENIVGFEDYKVESYMTLGQLVYKKLDDYFVANEINMPKYYTTGKEKIGKKKDDIEAKDKRLLQYFNDIAKNRVAGRVQLFNGIQKIEGEMCSIDVCSLYPYVMGVAPNYYTSGEIIEVENYDDKPSDLIGWFYCDIDQSNIAVKIMAGKTKEGNNWTENNFENVFISSVMIEFLKSLNCNVVIRNGIYYSEKIKGCHLFKPLLEVMKLKNGEDVKKEAGEEYNSALRETYKLIMNIPSGKLNQKMNRDERKILTPDEFSSLLENKKLSEINTLLLIDDKAHISYKKDESDCIKTVKPISNGALIYDYAKIYMYMNAYSKVPYSALIYTDTDSNKLRKEDFDEWKKYATNQTVPHWKEVEEYDERYKTHKMYEENSKVFGSYDEENKGKNYNLSYFIAKKLYLSVNKDKQHKKPSFHFKGVSKTDYIIPDTINTKEMTNIQLFRLYNIGGLKKIEDDYIEFFNKLLDVKKVKLLTFSMQKISSNSKKNVMIDEKERTNEKLYNVITSYRVKNITIKEELIDEE